MAVATATVLLGMARLQVGFEAGKRAIAAFTITALVSTIPERGLQPWR
jgi:hypothetical protein